MYVYMRACLRAYTHARTYARCTYTVVSLKKKKEKKKKKKEKENRR